jgi:hypothetical protein
MRKRRMLVVVMEELLTGNVPLARMYSRALIMSGIEMASAQSQSSSPSLIGSLQIDR